MKLPLIVSVPHAGLTVPEQVRDVCALTPEQVHADSDDGAAEIYRPFQGGNIIRSHCTELPWIQIELP